MNTGKYVFAQIISILDANDFKKCVYKYKGNYRVKDFTCWHQLLCMMFGQLANRESLSDLVLCLQSQRNKWYHLGIGNSISKSNLAYANEKRNWQIFADFAYMLIAEKFAKWRRKKRFIPKPKYHYNFVEAKLSVC
jgi:hypothetical protein